MIEIEIASKMFVGVLGLTLVSFYAAWAKFRIVMIRQDLFEIRDQLWDRVSSIDKLDDPAYQEIRDRINALIQGVKVLSLASILHTLCTRDTRNDNKPSPRSSCEDVQEAIDEAVEHVLRSVLMYVVYQRPFSGWLNLKLLGAAATAKRSVAEWFRCGGSFRLSGAVAANHATNQ